MSSIHNDSAHVTSSIIPLIKTPSIVGHRTITRVLEGNIGKEKKNTCSILGT